MVYFLIRFQNLIPFTVAYLSLQSVTLCDRHLKEKAFFPTSTRWLLCPVCLQRSALTLTWPTRHLKKIISLSKKIKIISISEDLKCSHTIIPAPGLRLTSSFTSSLVLSLFWPATFHLLLGLVGWGCRIHRLHLYWRLRLLNNLMVRFR